MQNQVRKKSRICSNELNTVLGGRVNFVTEEAINKLKKELQVQKNLLVQRKVELKELDEKYAERGREISELVTEQQQPYSKRAER